MFTNMSGALLSSRALTGLLSAEVIKWFKYDNKVSPSSERLCSIFKDIPVYKCMIPQ